VIAARARFVVAAVAIAVLVTVLPTVGTAGASPGDEGRSPSARTPIEHVVTVMQEGHTFDNYFGSFPGADGIPADTCMPVAPPAPRPCVKPFAVGDRPLEHLARNASAFSVAYAGGAMNGFVRAQSRGGVIEEQAMGVHRRADVPYYWDLATRNVLFDQFFASAPDGSLSSHLAWTAGAGAPSSSEGIPADGFTAPRTIFDQLQAHGVSWKFYVQNYDPKVTFRRAAGAAHGEQVNRVPLLAYPRFIDDPKLFAHIVPIAQYFEDLERGTLPAVSYIVPSGASERPPTSVTAGARFVQSLASALSSSTSWSTSAFVLTYDGWGGYFDHVAPTGGTGFRVPTLLMSPYARRGFVDHTRLETASIPRFIAENWGLEPVRAAGGSLEDAFDFRQAPRRPEVIGSTAPVPVAAPGRTSVVLWLYGAALAVAAVGLGALAWASRRRSEIVLP
jgi:phospholipase C